MTGGMAMLPMDREMPSERELTMLRKRLLLLACLIAVSYTGSASALGFYGFGVNIRHQPGYGYRCCGPGGCGYHRPWTYQEKYYYSNQMYPKYYYGFHANYMQSIGIPPGDIGLRTNGINLTPW